PAAPAATRPAAAAEGSLLVESRPAGARVRIDDREAGTTPLTLPGLAPGSYRVSIAREGYQTWTTTVRVVAGERARVAASLVGGRFEE
ncbi:MAG: PEGA domain-containing protein, partial [Vicinamibacterales bacterium]|nr:PEGA domain-containing protein [Vicinamibacterales bacterium]